MRDLAILATIIVFWGILGLGLTLLYDDPVIVEALVAQNDSYVTVLSAEEVNAIAANMSADDSGTYLFQDVVPTKTKGFLNMLFRMFTFRIPIVDQFPSFILYIIGILNWLLLTMVGLIVYRLIRHGGG